MSITLNRPTTAGQVVTVAASKEELSLVLSFPLSEAVFERDGDNLVLSFDAGEKIVLENFYTEYTGKSIPDFEVDGATIAGEDFFKSLGDETLMPAAGGDGDSADGGRYYDYDAAALAGGVNALGAVAGGSEFGRFGDLDSGEVAGAPRAAAEVPVEEPAVEEPPVEEPPVEEPAVEEPPVEEPPVEEPPVEEPPVVPPYNAGVSLSATATITEAGDTVIYTATLTNTAKSATTVTLDNGVVITIAAGATTGTGTLVVAAQDDVYVDPTSISATISTATGGGFDTLTVDATPAVTSIVDTLDTVTVELSATPTVSEDASTISYTVKLVDANGVAVDAKADVTVTLSNGATVTIAAGESEYAWTAPYNDPDVYVEDKSVTLAITGASQADPTAAGAFEELTFDTTPAVTAITDTIDTTTVNLTSVYAAGQIVVTATIDNAPQSDLTITLKNGTTITIEAGETTGSSGSVAVANGNLANFAIDSISDHNFEKLTSTNSIALNATPVIQSITSNLTVSEAGLATGTDASAKTTDTGTIVIEAKNGLTGFTINGQTISVNYNASTQTVTLGSETKSVDIENGTVTVTGIKVVNGEFVVEFKYELKTNADHDKDTGNDFSMTIPPIVVTAFLTTTSVDGNSLPLTSAPATSQVTILDDEPTDSSLTANISKNADTVTITAGKIGADGYEEGSLQSVDDKVTFVKTDGGKIELTLGEDGKLTTADGKEFGSLTVNVVLKPDGSYNAEYTFTRGEDAKSLTGKLEADYTITDQDGDVAKIDLTITLSDTEPVVYAIGKTFIEGSPDASGMYRVEVGKNFTTNAAVTIATGSGVESFGHFEVDGAGVLWFVANKELVGKLTPDQIVKFAANIEISVAGETVPYNITNNGLELQGSNIGNDHVTFNSFNGNNLTQSGFNVSTEAGLAGDKFDEFTMNTKFVTEQIAKGETKPQAQADFGEGNDVVVVNGDLVSGSMYLGNGDDKLTINGNMSGTAKAFGERSLANGAVGGDDEITVNGTVTGKAEIFGELDLDNARGGNDTIVINGAVNMTHTDHAAAGFAQSDVYGVIAGERNITNGSVGGDDKITVNGNFTQGELLGEHNLNAGSRGGNDTIIVNGDVNGTGLTAGYHLFIAGEAQLYNKSVGGDDKIEVNGTVSAGAADRAFVVGEWGAYGGSRGGNDDIYIKTLTGGTVAGEIEVGAVAGSTANILVNGKFVAAYGGDDKITIDTMSGGVVYGDGQIYNSYGGDDTITVGKYTGGTIYGGGKDTSTATTNLGLNAGGHDVFIYRNDGAAGTTLSLSATGQVSIDGSARTIYNFDGIGGGLGNDTLTGNALDNTLIGGGGYDKIYGLAGNDKIIMSEIKVGDTTASWGADGGAGGHDTFIYADKTNVGHTITLNETGTVNIDGTTYTNINNFEGIGGGAGNDTLTGNQYNNTLIGGGGNDTILGMAGDDKIIIDSFGNGKTIADGGADNDMFVFDNAVGSKISLGVDGSVSIHGVGNEQLQATNFEGIGGGAGNDTLDVSDFAGDKVSLTGGKGADTFIIGTNANQTATITDFGNLGYEDKLNLTEFKGGDYTITASVNNGTTTLSVLDGGDLFQTIVLENYTSDSLVNGTTITLDDASTGFINA